MGDSEVLAKLSFILENHSFDDDSDIDIDSFLGGYQFKDKKDTAGVNSP